MDAGGGRRAAAPEYAVGDRASHGEGRREQGARTAGGESAGPGEDPGDEKRGEAKKLLALLALAMDGVS